MLGKSIIIEKSFIGALIAIKEPLDREENFLFEIGQAFF
jgi:hypothetical protein